MLNFTVTILAKQEIMRMTERFNRDRNAPKTGHKTSSATHIHQKLKQLQMLKFYCNVPPWVQKIGCPKWQPIFYFLKILSSRCLSSGE